MPPFGGEPGRHLTKRVFNRLPFTTTSGAYDTELGPRDHTNTCKSHTLASKAGSGAAQYDKQGFLMMIVKINEKEVIMALESLDYNKADFIRVRWNHRRKVCAHLGRSQRFNFRQAL